MGNVQLAIVIPAYKPNFLEETLHSLTVQTCKKFNVYIGDDCSPFDLEKIVRNYKDKMSITYCRFSNNMGKNNLVGQWSRCIELSEEPWIWLFSDDDVMDKNCVMMFYESIKQYPQQNLFHFNVNVINQKGEKINTTHFPKVISSYDFALNKLRGKLNSYVVEYVFSRKIYNLLGGFESFDLAWNSDDATWIKFGELNGIRTIEGAYVNWRKSDFNISPNNKNREIVMHKLKADIDYIIWLNVHFEKKGYLLYRAMCSWFVTNLISYNKVLTKNERIYWICKLCKSIEKTYLYTICTIYYKVKLFFK